MKEKNKLPTRYCPHFKKSGTNYIHTVIQWEIAICPKCHEKLYKEITKQKEIEKSLEIKK